jgi:hypothetical protein
LDAENTTVVTNGYGLYVEAPGPNGTVTNKYGLIVESSAGFNGIGDTVPQATLSVGGHLQFDSTAPAVSSCGEGATIVGTDNAHRITVGTGTITACTVTFAEEWTNTPICLVQDSDGTAVRVSSASATVITISGADFNSDTLVVHCLGYE